MAAAENDVAVVISLGGDNCGMAELGYGEEGVAVAGSLDRVKRNLYGAVSAVLESDRAAQSRGELAVDLRLGGSCSDGAPADEVRNILRSNKIKILGCRGNAHLVHVKEQLARDAEAVIDVEGVVKVRIVDESLPADRGAGLLEVNAHDDLKGVMVSVAQLLDLSCILDCSLGIMD